MESGQSSVETSDSEDSDGSKYSNGDEGRHESDADCGPMDLDPRDLHGSQKWIRRKQKHPKQRLPGAAYRKLRGGSLLKLKRNELSGHAGKSLGRRLECDLGRCGH